MSGLFENWLFGSDWPIMQIIWVGINGVTHVQWRLSGSDWPIIWVRIEVTSWPDLTCLLAPKVGCKWTLTLLDLIFKGDKWGFIFLQRKIVSISICMFPYPFVGHLPLFLQFSHFDGNIFFWILRIEFHANKWPLTLDLIGSYSSLSNYAFLNHTLRLLLYKCQDLIYN